VVGSLQNQFARTNITHTSHSLTHTQTGAAGNRVLQATVKTKEAARMDYEQAVQKGETAALAESRGSSMFALTISIGDGDRTTVTIGYQQFLTSRRGQYEYMLALRSSKGASDGTLPEVLVDLDITDADGIKSIHIAKPEMSCAYQSACVCVCVHINQPPQFT